MKKDMGGSCMFKRLSKKITSIITATALVFINTLTAMPINPVFADEGIKYEFEEGNLDNCKAESWTVIDESVKGNPCDISDWSGTGFAYIEQKGSAVTIPVTVEKDGLYEIIIRYCQPFDPVKKVQYLNVNNVNQGEVSFPFCESFKELSAGYVKLNAGQNAIQIKAYWGYTLFDYLIVKEADESIVNLKPTRTLVNSNASDSTKRLYNYLCDIYGKHILAGQQEYCGSHNYNYSDSELTDNESEFEYILETTGKQVAVRGFDFLNYNTTSYWDDHAAERIVEWVNKVGGIATLCYHWGVPNDEGNAKFYYKSDAYPDGTTFSVTKALQEGTEENAIIMADIELLASKLKILQDADVPVLFRPLHEAEGAWFWWGAEGPEACKQLYYLLYDQLTNVYGLDNLIWVWTGYTFQTSPDWYPGDEYVDIIGYDKYNAYDGMPNLSSISSTFYNLVASTNGKKMVTMSENDSIPSLENLINDGAAWLWFCPWYNYYLMSETVNLKENLIEIYNSDYCITLDELPDLKTYPLDGYGNDETTPSEDETTTVEVSTSDEVSSVTETSEVTSTESTPSEGTGSSDIVTTISSDITTTETSATEETEVTETSSIIFVPEYGDVNLDGSISITDIIELNKYFVGTVRFDERQRENADCVHDGKIGMDDAMAIAQYLCGKMDKSDLGKTSSKS